MRLHAKRIDCRYMGALYAELRYGMQHDALRAGAWQSCLRFAPIQHMKTALDLAVHVQCVHVIRGTASCQSAREGCAKRGPMRSKQSAPGTRGVPVM